MANYNIHRLFICCIWKEHKLFASPTFRFCPSKGKEPLTSVYKMTPRLQMSTSGPSYFFPWKSSGAAYGGEPQNVSSLLPTENSLLKPKSAILMLESASNSKFSAYTNTHKRYNTMKTKAEPIYIWNQYSKTSVVNNTPDISYKILLLALFLTKFRRISEFYAFYRE